MCSAPCDARPALFHNQSVIRFLVTEEHNMGTSLYNKIPLGRGSVLQSTPVRAALLLAVCVSIALAWMAINTLK
jgi:hypothetical protein